MTEQGLVEVTQADADLVDRLRNGAKAFDAIPTGSVAQCAAYRANSAALREAADTIEAQADRIAKLEAEIAKLREERATVLGILEDAPELNPSNYDHDQVCELNSKMVEAYLFLAAEGTPTILENTDTREMKDEG